MVDPKRAAFAWALLASAMAAAPPDSTSATAALNSTAAQLPAHADGSPTSRLFNTLLITFGAIWLGRISVRLGLIEPDKGDLRAMAFYIGKVAFPLLIFNTVATAELGQVNIATLVACSLAKLAVMALTGLLAYFAYKSYRPVGQQVLTGTVFGFFAVASNDFAIGFPVIEAIYGPSMVVYIAANSLVGSFVFVPLTMVLFSIGQALSPPDGDKKHGKLGTLLSIVRDVLLNPVIICTVAGLLYKIVLGHTLARDGSKLVLPGLLQDAVKLLTAPFVMSALFLTGASLRSARLSVWPAALVLMKVVVCAFFSYLFGVLLVQGPRHVKERLVNFAFFYGSIPTSSAPLIFASQFDPGAAEVISTAILLGLLLAGPVMFSTAILLTDMGASANDVAVVQFSTIVASLVCGTFFLVLLGVLRRDWGFFCPAKKLLALYGVMLMVYESLALFFNPQISPVLCDGYNRNSMSLPSLALSWMQSALALIRLVLQFLLVFGPTKSPHNHGMGYMLSAACLMLALIPAVVASPTTIDQICRRALTQEWRLIDEDVWTGLLLVASVTLAVMGICKKRRDRRKSMAASEGNGKTLPRSAKSVAEDPGMQSRWVCEIPKDVIMPISVLFTLQMLIRLVNSTTVLLSDIQRESPQGSFLLMLMLETLLDHGQLISLTLAVFLSQKLTEHAAAAAPRLCPCLWRHVDKRLSRQRSTLLPDSIMGSIELPEEHEAWEEGEEELERPSALEKTSEDSVEESEDSLHQEA